MNIRSKLSTNIDKYGVYTDRQGSNADVAEEAPGVNPEYTDEHGSNWAFTRSFYGGVHLLKVLSLIRGSQHATSQIIAPGSSVLSPTSPCVYRADIRVILGTPAYPGKQLQFYSLPRGVEGSLALDY